MSLDIALLGANGTPEQHVAIGLDEHHQLMQLAPERSLVRRLRDYYADAEFNVGELQMLAEELAAIATSCRHDEGLSSLLDRLATLASVARRKGAGLVAIAD